MCTRRTRFVACWVGLILSVAMVGCRPIDFGDDEVTPYVDAKAEFDIAREAAVAEAMAPSVPPGYVILGFRVTESGVYKTSYLWPSGNEETLELQHIATVCVGDDVDAVEQECGSRTETRTYELHEMKNDRYLLVFPEGALSEPVTITDDDTSLVQAFDQGWKLWAPESSGNR